jgi:hypothetical protein
LRPPLDTTAERRFGVRVLPQGRPLEVIIHDPALGFGEQYFTALATRERWRGRMFIAAATAILSES